MYAVAGTQAESANQNYIALMRLSDINQGRHGSKARNEDDDDMSDSDDEGAPPQIHTSRVAHYGGVNRLRCMPQQPAVVASWGDTGLVQVCLTTHHACPQVVLWTVATSQGHFGTAGCIVYPCACHVITEVSFVRPYFGTRLNTCQCAPVFCACICEPFNSRLKNCLHAASLYSALLPLRCWQTCMLPHASG